MAIQSDRNLYRGVNAHLNSILQAEPGGWESFHSVHVTHLFEALDAQLPTGYFARSEKSLQISEVVPSTAENPPGGTKPDVTVYHTASSPASGLAIGTATATAAASTVVATPTTTIPISDTLTVEDYLTGIVIYQAGEGSLLGRPVTRIELLSPANKPPGSHYAQYLHKRRETLQSGLRLVEIDYLHERRPVIHALPSYPDHEEDSHPYTILISDPRPTFEQGQTTVYGFGVDEVFPVVPIPLAGADVLNFDFGVVYEHTFESSRFFRMVVDYEQELIHFERYSDPDQKRIRWRMAAIVKADGVSEEDSSQ